MGNKLLAVKNLSKQDLIKIFTVNSNKMPEQ